MLPRLVGLMCGNLPPSKLLLLTRAPNWGQICRLSLIRNFELNIELVPPHLIGLNHSIFNIHVVGQWSNRCGKIARKAEILSLRNLEMTYISICMESQINSSYKDNNCNHPRCLTQMTKPAKARVRKTTITTNVYIYTTMAEQPEKPTGKTQVTTWQSPPQAE